MTDYIEIRRARVNNLKDISLKIPRGQLIAVTGVSGSGKSSLAFDTLYAEGQRRYVESLSSYARQFLGKMKKPECDYIKGLPPAIAIEQKTISRNPRSTVGTSTEIYDYLRLLFARIGHTYSPISGQEVKKHSVEDIIACVEGYGKGTRFMVLSPVVGLAKKSIIQQQGYSRIEVNGTVYTIDESPALHETDEVYIVIDRLAVDTSEDFLARLTDSCETALFEGHGKCRIKFMLGSPSLALPHREGTQSSYDFSTLFEADGMTFEEPNENMFSFNSPLGACPRCEGFGKVIGIDERLVIPDSSRSIYDDAVVCWRGEKMSEWKNEFMRKASQDDFPIFEPYYNLTREQKDYLWHGPKGTSPAIRGNSIGWFPSIDRFFEFVKENQYKIQYRVMLARFRGKTDCPDCHGTRLKKEAFYVKIDGRCISDLVDMPISRLKEFFDELKLPDNEEKIAHRLITEITTRLQFLLDVGLGYLTLNRPSNTLSGGESQRINLTTSLGSSLVGSLYILDEPSIGLHTRDTDRLIKVMRQLTEVGNTVIVVEHDEDIMRAADYLIDVGPNAGRHGGEIVFAGSMVNDPKPNTQNLKPSYTLDYLAGRREVPVPPSRRRWNRFIELKGARTNNLKNIDVKIPLNVITVVTGVSGSGKSSLIKGTLYPALTRNLGKPAENMGEFSSLGGDINAIKNVEFVDQNPIGKSSRSNAATYVKAYDAIRELFASQQLAKQMGFTPQHFSFNTDGGRCEECHGAGVITVEMQFMADIVLECEECHGHRFKKDILEVQFHGKNVDDVLNMTISEAISFFGEYEQKQIVRKLKPLEDVGLGYIKLGQSSSTLSGGENQRVKLAYFIGQETQEPTLFIFDEPTTGLHFNDIQKLLIAMNALIERGHSIVIIEHNMEVIKAADYIIDLGPEGGNEGGYLIAQGTPEDIIKEEKSVTGRFLKKKLKN
ncbi:MAG: excinuclease ABC subunit UvrA [Prevotellaceae bacterium]|nr:excinuclease ABC subunit UvrA [Prevotellaceae bacterium]